MKKDDTINDYLWIEEKNIRDLKPSDQVLSLLALRGKKRQFN